MQPQLAPVAMDRVNTNIANALRNFQSKGKFEMTALRILIKMIDDEELKSLADEFHKIDKDNDGKIKRNELKSALEEKGYDITDSEIKSIISSLDPDKKGVISYSDFIIATIEQTKLK